MLPAQFGRIEAKPRRGAGAEVLQEHIRAGEHRVQDARLFRRLGVKSRTQTIHYARTHGMLTS